MKPKPTHADLAGSERQYDAVEPENRIVARELERRWNARLEELEIVRAKAREARAQHPALTTEELAMARVLGGDLKAVWDAPTTEARDRKRLLRSLIEEVQLRTEPKRHLVRIVWKGGTTADREIVRLRGGQLRATSAWGRGADLTRVGVRRRGRALSPPPVA
ncbi:MAG: hypothetical protein MJD61_06315 [Proteobacteria bacterium]|nr:hypothetical protein [Pseudomonadota bacterium]